LRTLFIYNPYSASEIKILDRVRQEFSSHVEEVEVTDFENIKNIYKIRTTPALIIIRDDLQGSHLITDGDDGSLRATAELVKTMQEEDLNIYQAETYRIDNLIKKEKIKAIDDYTLELIEGGII